MSNFELPYAGQRVLVTGHTGFTGGWLTLWLKALGAEVSGLALNPEITPNLFELAHIASYCEHHIADIRDIDAVRSVISKVRPALIFHLAAQPLVSRSYEDPIESYAVNALGTAHVLEAARVTKGVKGAVCITTDKVYEDEGWAWGYRETDRLGGKDPYSASKACAEIIAASYRRTMAPRGNGMQVAIGRGGNIIGGGDWAHNRIVPDFFRAVTAGHPLILRNPEAVRPWQHVLALIHGYLVLGAGIFAESAAVGASFNFGPNDADAQSVRVLVESLSAHWKRPDIRYEPGTFLETKFLRVDSSKARSELGWQPPIGFQDTIALTVEWYRSVASDPSCALAITEAQIAHYRALVGKL